jgi:hypothetical protein
MQSGGGFGDSAKRRVVEEFVVAYYNGSVKPNVAEKNLTTGREIEFLMDGPQFQKIKRDDMWSNSSAVGTGYQYRVVYKDKRYSDLEQLLQIYTGAISVQDDEKLAVEQKLYEMILLMIKEGRLPKTFKLQSPSEAENQKVSVLVEEMSRSLEELGKRVRKLEEQLAGNGPKQEENPPIPAAPIDAGESKPGVANAPDDPSSTSSPPLWGLEDILPSRGTSSQSKAP